MKKTLLIIDDLHPNPDGHRKCVLESEFGNRTGPDGGTYSNVSVHHELGLKELVSEAVGYDVNPAISFYRFFLDKEKPHFDVHADNMYDQMASVLYLNPPCEHKSGTAFWRHKETGLEEMPNNEQVISWGHDPKEWFTKFVTDWHDISKWEQVGFVAMKYNRFITYPTRLLHSRWPLEGFGKDKESARLIHVYFYNAHP